MRILIIALCSILAFASCKKKEFKFPNGEMKILKAGNGTVTPKEGEYAMAHVAMIEDGKVLDDTRTQSPNPIPIPIPMGIDTAKNMHPVLLGLKNMHVGDSAHVIMILTEDQKKQLPPDMKGKDKFNYYIVLSGIKTKAEYDDFMAKENEVKMKKMMEGMKVDSTMGVKINNWISDHKAGKLTNMKKTPGGVTVYTLVEGNGTKAEIGKSVTVDYYGTLMDGKKFDSSFGRGEPTTFQLVDGGLIKGWIEGIPTMKVGSAALLFIPSELGYGAQGNPPQIPANSDLFFYIELKDVK